MQSSISCSNSTKSSENEPYVCHTTFQGIFSFARAASHPGRKEPLAEFDWKNTEGKSREEVELVPARACYDEDNCHTCEKGIARKGVCWDLGKGLVRKGEVEWRIKGREDGPIVRFVAWAEKTIGCNRDLSEKWLDR